MSNTGKSPGMAGMNAQLFFLNTANSTGLAVGEKGITNGIASTKWE